jgi:hypothetical protein
MERISYLGLLLLVVARIALADSISPEMRAQMQEFIRNNASSITSATEFFHYGEDCYAQRLKRLVYYQMGREVVYFSNDREGHCYYTSIFLGDLPLNVPGAHTCLIDAKLSALLFTPWNLDALKNLDAGMRSSAMLQSLAIILNNCLKQHPLSINEAINQVYQTSQITSYASVHDQPK